MQIERTKNTTRNIGWGLLEKIVQIVLPFVTRTLILKLIGEKYLGLNSLFTSIISVLNLADLGFGVAITYSMYKPIAENDFDKLNALLNYYRKIYRIIGVIVLAVGLGLMPFLDSLISGEVPSDISIHLLFAIYLANAVLSYWLFAYKKSLLHACHRDDVVNKISLTLTTLQYGLQIALLYIFDNYYIYIIVLPIITLINNVATGIITKKLYPNLYCKGSVDKETSKDIKKRVSGAFIGKVCGTTRNSLDSVFISAFLGLSLVAIYGNYFYILTALHSVLNIITVSMSGGVGNSIAKETEEKNYKDFNRFTFLYSWLSGWFACCMICIYQPFMRIWVGESLMLEEHTMILFGVYLYVMCSSDIKNVYYTAAGLWWEGRFRAILEVAVNFVLNIVGAKFFGIFGIIMATIITMIFINFLYGAQILFKHYFKNQKLSKYYLKHLIYVLVIVLVSALTYYICSLLPNSGILYLLLKALICAVVPNVLLFVIYCRTNAFKSILPTIKSILRIVKPKKV